MKYNSIQSDLYISLSYDSYISKLASSFFFYKNPNPQRLNRLQIKLIIILQVHWYRTGLLQGQG